MKVTLYTTDDCAECVRVSTMLQELAAGEGFDLHVAASPSGAPAPCVRFDAPGSPFYRADGLTESQFLDYLHQASAPESDSKIAVRGNHNGKGIAGSPPTVEFEARHPVRSFLWRHRVGSIVT